MGAAIRDKDALRTGAASNLQVRFIDDSLVSLRENSELRVENFAFNGKDDGSERAFFRLLKGGLRQITGIIGRRNHNNYELNSLVATIGVRGTDFAATLCQQNCRNDDGSLSKDGLFGRVIGMAGGTNRIVVTNAAGENLLGINENFHVADRQSPLQRLLEAPGFVTNRLESRKQGGTTQSLTGTGTEQTTTGGSQSDSRATDTPLSTTTPQTYVSNETRDSTGGLSLISPTTAMAISVSGSVDGALAAGGLQLTRSGSGSSEILTAFNAPSDPNRISGSVSSSTDVTDTGFNSATNAHWGRWTSGTVVDADGVSHSIGASGTGNFHYIYADLTPLSVIAAMTGTVSYSHLGGTTPTDSNNNVATSSTFGAVSVNFTARTLNFPTLTWAFTSVAYSFANVSGTLTANTVSPANTIMVFNATQTASNGCAGGACTTATSATINITGSFAGAAGDKLGAAFATTSAAGKTNSVQAFSR
ncbi:MAG: FecR family protein [Sulfuricaulis sp.]|nr:FecR family protein [Sulfuricaulis sp.]